MTESEICRGQLHGVVVLDKPAGVSSAKCLLCLKRQGQKKIGHAGTLDPMARGVLIALLGNATKLSGFLLESGKKIYSGRIRLGVVTDTWDTTGEILAEKPAYGIDPEGIEAIIREWPLMETQEVPAYSAAKYNGQPLYKLARKGHDTPVKVKSVRIESAGLLAYNPPFVDFRVTCGSGVYIRSLAHSLGMRLGCGAALSDLTREYSHPFSLRDATSPAEIENGFALGHVRPIASALPDWPVIEVNAKEARAIRNGNAIAAKEGQAAKRAILCHDGHELALAAYEPDAKGGYWRVRRGLWNDGPEL